MTSTASEKPLIVLDAVGKDYPILRSGGGRLRTAFELLTGRAVQSTYRALDGIDLSVGRGESWGVIGENGAGKSTLLKIVSGVAKPTRGTISVNGRLSALLELGTGFHPEYTGRENIFLASALMGGRRDDTAANVERIVEFADIGEHIDQPVKTYSTGMVVRLGFAVATSLRPDVLITDEVLAVGDESFQKKCLRWMEQYRATGGALLLCSHSMYHIQSLCENALWIEHGRVRAKGDSYAVTQAYLEYHESKQAAMAPGHSHAVDPNVFPVIDSLWVCGADGIERSTFEMGEDLMLCGTMNCPGDQPTRIAFGIARKDLTPVFGAFSEDAAFVPNRIGLCKYAFRVRFPNIPLLPGSYVLRGHTMDEFGLRLIDTAIIEVRVTGKTRAHGLVTVPHRWENGNERNVPNGD